MNIPSSIVVCHALEIIMVLYEPVRSSALYSVGITVPSMHNKTFPIHTPHETFNKFHTIFCAGFVPARIMLGQPHLAECLLA